MSSTVLYLAIVAVWAVVLVPMWLRRDTEAVSLSRILHRRPSSSPATAGEPAPDEEPGPEAESESHEFAEDFDDEDRVVLPRIRRNHRAAVIARRRRRTTLLTALLLASLVAALSSPAPWWIMLPPVGLLAGHLSLLRVAVGMDTARREEQRQARRAAALEAEALAAAEEESAAEAEIIDLDAHRDDVFDQFAEDTPRAVGD